MLKHKTDEKAKEYEITKSIVDDKITFDGLPEALKKQLIAFSKEELDKYTSTCLNVILK